MNEISWIQVRGLMNDLKKDLMDEDPNHPLLLHLENFVTKIIEFQRAEERELARFSRRKMRSSLGGLSRFENHTLSGATSTPYRHKGFHSLLNDFHIMLDKYGPNSAFQRLRRFENDLNSTASVEHLSSSLSPHLEELQRKSADLLAGLDSIKDNSEVSIRDFFACFDQIKKLTLAVQDEIDRWKAKQRSKGIR